MQHLTFVDIFNTNTVNPFNCCFKEKNTLICIEYDNKDVNINELIIEVKYIKLSYLYSLPFSQSCPCHPSLQLQTYEALLLMHVPLFSHK